MKKIISYPIILILMLAAFVAGTHHAKAYIGVGVSPVPDMLSHQLRLAKDIGLLVEFVYPNSPAHKAGVNKYDVIKNFNNQLLISLKQFDVLVNQVYAGENVKLTVIRKGRPLVLNVALAERKEQAIPLYNPNNQGVRKVSLPGLTDMENWQAFFKQGDLLEQLINGTRIVIDNPVPVQNTVNGSGGQELTKRGFTYTVDYADKRHKMSFKMVNGNKDLTVHDLRGKLIYDGPINSAEEKARLPRSISKKLIAIEKVADRQANFAQPAAQ